MFKYSFVILCYVAFVSKQCSALNWCSSDALPTLLQCGTIWTEFFQSFRPKYEMFQGTWRLYSNTMASFGQWSSTCKKILWLHEGDCWLETFRSVEWARNKETGSIWVQLQKRLGSQFAWGFQVLPFEIITRNAQCTKLNKLINLGTMSKCTFAFLFCVMFLVKEINATKVRSGSISCMIYYIV